MTKEIEVTFDVDEYDYKNTSKSGYSDFVNSKLKNAKEEIQEALNKTGNTDFEASLRVLENSGEEIHPEENQVLIVENKIGDDIYSLFDNIDNNINSIQNSIADMSADKIQEVLEGNAPDLSPAENVLTSFMDIQETPNASNPFDSITAMPFSLPVSFSLPGVSGLRKDYLKMMQSIKANTDDEYSEKYSEGLTEVSMQYFSSGVITISAHTSSAYGESLSAVGAGISTALNCSQGYNDCRNKLVNFYKKKNTQIMTIEDEAMAIADAISSMYDKGKVEEMVYGVWIHPGDPPYPMPLSENNIDSKVTCSPNKILLYTSLLAAYKMLENMAKTLQKTQDFMGKIGVGKKFECTDDIVSLALAAGVKAMLAVSRFQTYSSHSGPLGSGNGFLLPVGP